MVNTKKLLQHARHNMIEQQIRPNKIINDILLNLFTNIKREDFILDQYKNLAYSDTCIPLPSKQHMLKPLLEAQLIDALSIKVTDKILEIGTGSAYVTTLLANLGEFVYSLEIDQNNFDFAKANLEKISNKNIQIFHKDGFNGLQEFAPFDKILIGGGCNFIPHLLLEQLRIGGTIIAVVGDNLMHLTKIEKKDENNFTQIKLLETNAEYLDNFYIKNFIF